MLLLLSHLRGGGALILLVLLSFRYGSINRPFRPYSKPVTYPPYPTIPLINIAPKCPLKDGFNGLKRDLTHKPGHDEARLAINWRYE